MRVHRMLEITTILLGREQVTAGELAERFEVSVRTIYRDVEALSQAGVPVYMQKGKGGGISLMEGYAMDRALISDEEARDLMLALQTLRSTAFPDSEALMEKVAGLLRRSPMEDWVEIDFSNWGNSPGEREKLERIKLGIQRQRMLHIDYVSAAGKRGSRTVWPLKLLYKSKTWYLLAHCTLREEQRMFRLSRIIRVDLLEAQFSPPETAVSPDLFCAEGAIVSLHLRFSPEVLYRLYDEFSHEEITLLADGRAEVRVSYPEDEWVYSFLHSFGHHVEVLTPERVRENMASRLRRALEHYQQPGERGEC